MIEQQRKYLALVLLNLVDDTCIWEPKSNTVYTNDKLYNYINCNVKPLSEFKKGYKNNENND